jgi:hypothetical protein
MFWHPQAEPFVVSATVGHFVVPDGKVAMINHGGAIYVTGPGGLNLTYNTDKGPLWLAAGTSIRFQLDVAGLLLPTA